MRLRNISVTFGKDGSDVTNSDFDMLSTAKKLSQARRVFLFLFLFVCVWFFL